jgi:hypothetical protein
VSIHRKMLFAGAVILVSGCDADKVKSSDCMKLEKLNIDDQFRDVEIKFKSSNFTEANILMDKKISNLSDILYPIIEKSGQYIEIDLDLHKNLADIYFKEGDFSESFRQKKSITESYLYLIEEFSKCKI